MNSSTLEAPMKESSSQILFAGSAGRLHGFYHHVENAKSIALVLPPHPKYGGTMNNKVVVALYNEFVKRGIATLKINFRGVGLSEGKSTDRDIDLIKDANSAIEWLEYRYPLVDYFWIGGFSSGSWLALNLAMRRPEVSGFVVVGMPLRLHDFSFLAPCTVPGLIIQGENDCLCNIQELKKITDPISVRVHNFKLDIIQDGDHKMSSPEQIEMISTKVEDYLKTAAQYEVDSTLPLDMESYADTDDTLEELEEIF